MSGCNLLKTEIYFFSGTGNSLVIAKDLAARLEGDLLPIIPYLNKTVINTDAKIIGVVFPIYDFKAPELVENFVRHLADIKSKYIFAVASYGFLPLKATRKLAKIVESCGGKLSGGFIVQMPHNGIGHEPSVVEEQKELFNNWSVKLEMIKQYVVDQNEGKLETKNFFRHFILSGLFLRTIRELLPVLRQVIFKGWNSLTFFADEKCNGCGTCNLVCPLNNITLTDGKPLWHDNCAACFACLQWCPKEAIQAGKLTVNKKRYHHPNVTLSDIIKQKTTTKNEKT